MMNFAVRFPLTRLLRSLHTSFVPVQNIQSIQARIVLLHLPERKFGGHLHRCMYSLKNPSELEDDLVQNIENFGLKNFKHKYDRKLVKEVCSKFLSIGVEREDIIRAFCQPAPIGQYSDPPLFVMDMSLLQKLLDVFINHDVTPRAIIRVVDCCGHDIKSLTPSDLDAILMKLVSLPYFETSITNLLDVCPPLIFFDDKLDWKLRKLRSIFPEKELMHLLRNAPNVLVEPWKITMEKLNYINEEMGLDQPHIAYNKTMSYSIQHIKDRHEAMLRAGIYKKPKLHRNRLSYLMNEKLEIIMESSDAQFCKRILKIPMEDYECFLELLHRERQEDFTGVQMDDYDSDEDEIRENEAKANSYHSHLERPLRKMPMKDYLKWLRDL